MDKYFNVLKNSWAGILGLIIFSLFFGWGIVAFHNTAWLIQGGGDALTHLLGWLFFYHEPWHFPIGKIQNYHFPVGTSIVYSDSLPLFAILFKPFRSILPENFQYFGLWIATCYFLQGFFADCLAKKITSYFPFRFLMVLFFLLTPVFLYHNGIIFFGQWVILAALYLYFSKTISKQTHLAWSILILVTALISAYLLAIVLLLWVCFLIKNVVIEHLISYQFLAFIIPLNVALLIFVFWQIGYFVVPLHNMDGGGYGNFSANLLFLIDPANHFSKFILPSQHAAPGYGEAYGYLGLGMLLLLLLAIYELIKTPPNRELLWKISPLLMAGLFFLIVATAPMIAIGHHILFIYPMPAFLNGLASGFRASGRFVWPICYMITLFIFWTVINQNKKWVSVSLLSFALVIQIIDLYPLARIFGKEKPPELNWQSSLQSPFWNESAKIYSNVILVPPLNFSDKAHDMLFFQNFGLFSATHNLTFNAAILARADGPATARAYGQLFKDIAQGKLNPNALYIFTDEKFLDALKPILRREDGISVIDGYEVVAPKGLNYPISHYFSTSSIK